MGFEVELDTPTGTIRDRVAWSRPKNLADPCLDSGRRSPIQVAITNSSSTATESSFHHPQSLIF
jgi:hypothetical protein